MRPAQSAEEHAIRLSDKQINKRGTERSLITAACSEGVIHKGIIFFSLFFFSSANALVKIEECIKCTALHPMPLSSEAESLNRTCETRGCKRCTIIYRPYALFNGTVGKIVFVHISDSVRDACSSLNWLARGSLREMQLPVEVIDQYDQMQQLKAKS